MVVIASFFERIFKFSALQFGEGELGFQAGDFLLIAALIFVGLVGVFLLVYYAASIYRSDRSRFTSLLLRMAALLILCIPLLEPVLMVPDVVPRENFVAVLVDESQSMGIPDGHFGSARTGDVRHLLFDETTGLLQDLRQDFNLRYYTFSERAVRRDTIPGQAAAGEATNLAAAIDRVRSDFTGIPLSGIIVFTDGHDTSSEPAQAVVDRAAANGIPLHVVGVGQETHASDRELIEVAAADRVEEETGAEIDLKVRSRRSDTEPVTFSLYRGDDLVLTENRTLSGNGVIDQFSFFYEPEGEGAEEYTLEVSTSPDELVTQNNAQQLLINTRTDTSRVLYVEGHPRYEFKYAKRVLQNDPAIDFVSIARTGPGRYYRQGIESPEQLTGGFADSTEEMNTYDALILGDIEASAFTPEQLTMIEQFVRVRGGGLLMLGGHSSFGAGNYQNTPVADALPVILSSDRSVGRFLETSRSDGPDSLRGYRFTPTPAGLDNSILKLSSDPSVNRTRWANMPRLPTLNPLGDLKAGATLLAEAVGPDDGQRYPALVAQRYGKGRSVVLPTAGTWRWQMDLPAEDGRYERFWRQLARWLTASAPNRVNLVVAEGKFSPEEPVPLEVQLFDSEFRPIDGAAVHGTLTDPTGTEHDIEFHPNLVEPGTYETTYSADTSGVHRLSIRGEREGQALGTDESAFLVSPSGREFFEATLKRDFLRTVAAASGGFYYDASDIERLPTNLVTGDEDRSIYDIDYLWDMPFLFMLAIVLLSIEWVLRRRQGLP